MKYFNTKKRQLNSGNIRKERGEEKTPQGNPVKNFLKRILKSFKPPKRVAELIKRSNFLRDYVKEFLGYLERTEFKKALTSLELLDRDGINETLVAISEPVLSKEEFTEFRKYLYDLYSVAYKEHEQFLAIVKALKVHSLALLPEKKIESPIVILRKLKEGKLITYTGYRELKYRVALFLNREFKVVDARIFATKDTRLKFIKRAKERNLYILITPNPVKIPKEFWTEYRWAKGPAERVSLIKKYGLLKDEQAFYTELILDIDSPYPEVEKAVKELLKELGVHEEPFQVKLMKTGSGNARLIIPLKVEVWKPLEKGRNGHTHLENLRETVAILGAYFQRKGLNVDTTSIDRLNHQIWCYSAHPKPDKYEIKRVVPTLKRITPYNLYRKVKKLQKDHQLYTLKKGNKEINLTTYFGWRPEFKRAVRKAKVIKVPKFIAELTQKKALNTLSEDIKLYYWKKAVKSLADKHSHHRFTYVILPAIGWAIYLGLDRYEVESYLKELLNDRDLRKTEKDIEIAFRVANSLEFDLPKKVRSLNFETLLKEVLKHLLRNGQVARQDLLKEIFGNQKWLTDLVMNSLVKIGLVEAEFVKAGKGRPRKVFHLTEKGKQVADHLPEKVLQEAWRVAIGQDFSSKNFSQSNSSAKPSFKEVVGSGRRVKEDLINLTKKSFCQPIGAVGDAQISLENLERKAPEKELRKEERPKKIPLGEGKNSEKRKRKDADRRPEKVDRRPEKADRPPKRADHSLEKADRRKTEEILNRLRKGKPKRGGISSIGEVIKRLKSGGKSPPMEEDY